MLGSGPSIAAGSACFAQLRIAKRPGSDFAEEPPVPSDRRCSTSWSDPSMENLEKKTFPTNWRISSSLPQKMFSVVSVKTSNWLNNGPFSR